MAMNSAAGRVANGARTIPSRAMRREYTASPVAVIVMGVGCVRMLVLDRTGRVRMAVRLRSFPALVRVLMVRVVNVNVDVHAVGMVMAMQMPLLHQEPRRDRDQRGGAEQPARR